MADTNGAPRRVSMAYILGFSNKPFKDGGPPAPPQPPPPRHPSNFKQMVTTPGGVLEWAASDGRRGRLTGPGKPRLTATNLAQVPSANVSVKAASKKSAPKTNPAEDDGGMGMFGLFEDAPAAPVDNDAAKHDKPTKDSSEWTKEQDEKLMDMKGEEASWVAIATEVGKDQGQCKGRFKQIKPKDWKLNSARSGGGNKQKQGNQKGEKKRQEQEKKDEPANGGFDISAHDAWGVSGGGGNGTWNTTNDAANGGLKETTWGDNCGDNNDWGGDGDNKGWGDGDNKSEKKGNNNDQWGSGGWGAAADNNDGDSGDVEGFNADDNGWSGGGEVSGGNGATGWNIGGGGGDDAWATGNDASWGNENNGGSREESTNKSSSNKATSNKDTKAPSNKAASQSGSKQQSAREPEKPSTSAPTKYELKPDSTFSADDLRLIAKILQQDCQMVWNRVSWRFKDKTGRNLHPDVFEKKITGKIEESSSERGQR